MVGLIRGLVEWTTVDPMVTMQQIVARASNRVFVGLPLCMLLRSLRSSYMQADRSSPVQAGIREVGSFVTGTIKTSSSSRLTMAFNCIIRPLYDFLPTPI